MNLYARASLGAARIARRARAPSDERALVACWAARILFARVGAGAGACAARPKSRSPIEQSAAAGCDNNNNGYGNSNDELSNKLSAATKTTRNLSCVRLSVCLCAAIECESAKGSKVREARELEQARSQPAASSKSISGRAFRENGAGAFFVATFFHLSHSGSACYLPAHCLGRRHVALLQSVHRSLTISLFWATLNERVSRAGKSEGESESEPGCERETSSSYSSSY